MKFLFSIATAFVVVNAVFIAIAVGLGVLLQWILADVEIGIAILIGAVSELATIFVFANLIRSFSFPPLVVDEEDMQEYEDDGDEEEEEDEEKYGLQQQPRQRYRMRQPKEPRRRRR